MKKLVRESLNEVNNVSYDWLLNEVPVVSKHDDSMFCITLSDKKDGDVEACAMGSEFSPDDFGMTLKEMVDFIEEGIQYFLSLGKSKITPKLAGDYSDFFIPEFDDEGYKSIPTDYVIAKMICGKENAKWNAEQNMYHK